MESTDVTFHDTKYPGFEEDEDEAENAPPRFKNQIYQEDSEDEDEEPVAQVTQVSEDFNDETEHILKAEPINPETPVN